MKTLKKSIFYTKTFVNFIVFIFNQSLNDNKLDKKSG